MDPGSPALDPPPDEQGYKRCPDCAELVRAAARKCRFCGYRFDRPPEPEEATTDHRRTARTARRDGPHDVRELLEEWAIELDHDEQVAFFLPARAKLLNAPEEHEVFGYALLTDSRLLMLTPPARGILGLIRRESKTEPAEIAFELPFSGIGEVVLEQRWRRAELRIDSRIRLSEISGEQVAAIRSHIEARR